MSLLSLCSISYSRLGNCCGTPLFPVLGYCNVETALSVLVLLDGMVDDVLVWCSVYDERQCLFLEADEYYDD